MGDTWAGMVRSNPDLNLTLDGRRDPAQQDRAMQRFTQQNVQALTRAGVPVTDKNVFMTHFLGADGAAHFFRALTANPNGIGLSIFPKEAHYNPTIFTNSKTKQPRSLSQIYSLMTGNFGDGNTTGSGPKILGGAAPLPTFDTTNTGLASPLGQPADMVHHAADIWIPPSAGTDTDAKVEHRDSQIGFLGALGQAWKYDTFTSQIFRGSSIPDYDPNAAPYLMAKDDYDRHMDGLNPHYGEWFEHALTPAHADRIRDEALAHQKAMEAIEEHNGIGFGLARFAVDMLDPVAIAGAAATGGLGAFAKGGRAMGLLGRTGLAAGEGAVSMAALTAATKAIGATDAHDDDIVHASLTGAALGAGFGAFHAWLRPEVNGIVKAGNKGLAELTDEAAGGGGVAPGGAAPAGGQPVTGGRQGLLALDDKDAPDTAMGNARFSLAAELGRSKDPGVRALGSALVEDGVGKSDNSLNPHSAELELRSGHNSYRIEYATTYLPVLRKWREEPTNKGRDVAEFERDVFDALTGSSDPTVVDRTSPAIRPLVAKMQDQNRRLLDLARNPLLKEGGEGRPLNGFGTIDHDDTYLRRMWSPQKLYAYVDEHGVIGLQQLLMRGIRAATPDIEDGLLERLSDGFARNVYNRATGRIDPKVSRMFGADDLEEFQRDLRDVWGLSADDAAAIRSRLERNPDAGKDARAKRRALMDVNAEFGGMAIKDLLNNDASFLHFGYMRHMWGQISLARVRIRNPHFDEAAAKAAQEEADGAYTAALRTATQYHADHVTAVESLEAAQKAHDDALLAHAEAGKAVEDARANVPPEPVETTPLVAPRRSKARSKTGGVLNSEALAIGNEMGKARSAARYGTTVTLAAPATPAAEIVGAIRRLGGDPQMDGVRLNKLREALPHVPREDLDRELLRMFKARELSLMNLDNPRDITAVGDAALRHAGGDLHTAWLTKTSPRERAPSTEAPPSNDRALALLRAEREAKLTAAKDAEGQLNARATELAGRKVALAQAKEEEAALRKNNDTAEAYVEDLTKQRDEARKRQLESPGSADPTSPLLVNGITGERDWQRLLDETRQGLANRGVLPQKIEGTMEALQFAHDRLSGIPHPLANAGWARALRFLNQFNIARLGASFVFAQAGEISNMISGIGVKHMLANMPSFRRIVTADSAWLKRHGLPREMEQIFGAGTEAILAKLEDARYHHDLGAVPLEGRNDWLTKAEHTVNTVGRHVRDLSGFSALDGIMRQWAVHGIVGKFADMAVKMVRQDGKLDLTSAQAKRMRFWGLDDDTFKRVLGQINDHSDVVPGQFFKGTKVNRINLDQWADKEAAMKFTNAVQRFASKVIQDNDIGSLHKWFSHPLWRTMLQLRYFTVAAWDKKLLHNLHMRDGNAAAYFAVDTVVPAMIYAMQTSIAAQGRADKDKFLADRLSVGKLAAAGFQRSGYSSLLPMGIDTMGLPFHHPVFDTRSSGQSSDILFGNTTTSLVNDVSKGIGAVANPMIHGRARTQDEVRSMQRLLSNHFLLTPLLNHLTASMPAHVPKFELHGN